MIQKNLLNTEPIWMIYNPNQKRKILIVYVVIIADIFINRKLNPIVTALFIRRRNYSSDNDFQDFMHLHKKCTAKPYSFLVIDIALV